MTDLTLETAFRLLVIGQELLIATVLLSGRGAAAVRISGALLALGVAGYLFVSDANLPLSATALTPPMTLLAIVAPYCLWLFARAVFEAPMPDIRLAIAVVVLVVTGWVVGMANTAVPPAWADSASDAVRVVAVAVVVHALWLVWAGRPDDLVEPRRSLRLVFVGAIAVQILVVLIVELAIDAAAVPAWVDLLNVVVIGLLTLGIAVPLLQLNVRFAASRRAALSSDSNAAAKPLRAAESVLRGQLLDLMASGYYRETGLTIGRLAERLGYPEHQVRRLINGHLGYRNFSTFLNDYRIAEARKRLADCSMARTPILTIALDLGYASIGPFNRSFKERTGSTPSDYRRRQFDTGISDSE